MARYPPMIKRNEVDVRMLEQVPPVLGLLCLSQYKVQCSSTKVLGSIEAQRQNGGLYKNTWSGNCKANEHPKAASKRMQPQMTNKRVFVKGRRFVRM